ncbi:MAG TPA: hypothetical protein VI365_23105 [Trebonia sp.]
MSANATITRRAGLAQLTSLLAVADQLVSACRRKLAATWSHWRQQGEQRPVVRGLDGRYRVDADTLAVTVSLAGSGNLCACFQAGRLLVSSRHGLRFPSRSTSSPAMSFGVSTFRAAAYAWRP